jgi:hypothetical protein
MSSRMPPVFKPMQPIRAPHLNQLGSEQSRLNRLQTGGTDLFVDNACGRFYMSGGVTGSSVKPFIVTEGDASIAAAIYRTSHGDYGFAAKRVNRAGTAIGGELQCHADFMYGVIYTGSIFWATLLSGDWMVVSTGADYWTTGVTNEAIDANDVGMVELYADGPLIDATSRTSVPITTSVDVEFDDREQLFACTAQDCPPAPA